MKSLQMSPDASEANDSTSTSPATVIRAPRRKPRKNRRDKPSNSARHAKRATENATPKSIVPVHRPTVQPVSQDGASDSISMEFGTTTDDGDEDQGVAIQASLGDAKSRKRVRGDEDDGNEAAPINRVEFDLPL